MKKTNKEIIQENLKTIEEWSFQGMTQKEIAELLGMAESTFRQIKRQEISISSVLKKTAKARREIIKEQVKEVEKSLFKRATGYNVKEIVPVKVKKEYFNDDGKKYIQEEVEEVTIEKHVPADIQAAKFFLVNKAKEIWQDNPHKVENDKETLKIRKKEAEGKEW